MSVVPPRDAGATAQRIADALSGGSAAAEKTIFYVDLNAVSPTTVRAIAGIFVTARVSVNFIDGCILGAPPRPKKPNAGSGHSSVTTATLQDGDEGMEWSQPNIPVSGPHQLSLLPDGAQIAKALKLRSVSPEIGAASGLKMCFSAITKGLLGLVTQSFTTAHRLGVTDELMRELGDVAPDKLASAEKLAPDMPPKAYRWIKEMEEISDTMHDDGGWSKDLFRGLADVYRSVAEDEVLGEEKIGKRKRGTTIADLAAAMAEGLERKRKKTE